MNVNLANIGRRCAFAVTASATVAFCPARAAAQVMPRDTVNGAISITNVTKSLHDSAANAGARFYRRLAAGFATSILLHEASHFAASYAMGFHPHFGFDKGRPTAFSGIDEDAHHRAQFIFSAAGLAVQDALDELVLDIPHKRGGAFERGILAGGIGTTLFYITVGRNARVSDISVMARTSSLSRSQLSLIFGSVAGIQAFRVSRDHRYSRFFVAPAVRGGVKAGISIPTH